MPAFYTHYTFVEKNTEQKDKYITDCLDVIEHLYSQNKYAKNIDILKEYDYKQTNSQSTNYNAYVNNRYAFLLLTTMEW